MEILRQVEAFDIRNSFLILVRPLDVKWTKKFWCSFRRTSALAITFLFLTIGFGASAQWMLINQNGGNSHSSAAFEVRDTSRGILFPRLTTNQMNSIANTAGLLVYNTDSSAFYYNNGSSWNTLTPSADNLGNHTATQHLKLNGFKISNDGDNEGLVVDNNGKVSIFSSISGSGNSVLRANGDVWTDGLGTGYYMTNSNIGITGNNSNSRDMRFITGGIVRMRISGGGQVGVGTLHRAIIWM